MSDTDSTFGRRIQSLPANELLVQERQVQRDEPFKPIEALVTNFLIRSLRGQKIALIAPDKAGNDHLRLPGLSDAQHAFIAETYGLERQRGRGALFHPAKVSLKVGLASLPHAFARYGRFGYGMAWEERGQVEIKDSADTILFWALLEPLFEALYLPITLRSQLAGKKSREEQQAYWAEVDAFYEALGWQPETALAVMRWGGGWHQLRVQEQWEAKTGLIVSLLSQTSLNCGALARIHQLRPLITAYYKKAKSGQATRKQVLTKALERPLAGWFGGDWLAFLAYLGELPHPSEQIVTALPEPKVFVGGAGRTAEVAAKAGLPAEEVQKMLAAFWQQEDSSPVEERVAVLRRYWQVFDAIHDQQSPGMTPLWGLVDEDRFLRLPTEYDQGNIPYTLGLYRKLLPADLIAAIERLWGTAMLSQYPERIVTEAFPHTAMAEAFGPALKFWHGCALTAWFVCEGPMSRTDMAGLAHYHRRQLEELEKAGTPVDPRLFEELIEGEKRLGPEQTVVRDKRATQAEFITMTVSSTYTRRNGFERLREIISRHRKAWTQRYGEAYLRSCWELQIREAATQHALLLGQRGKPPTLRQFAKYATAPTNHWFGGDISKLYAAMGEKAPCQPQYTRCMPADPLMTAQRIMECLKGRLPSPHSVAQHIVWYFQLQEALDSPPNLAQFGCSKLKWMEQEAHSPVDQIWNTFQETVYECIRS